MNSNLLEKIQALLTKADCTEFEAEAESFYAKAQQLMLENAIDEQMLRSVMTGAQTREVPTSRIVHYSMEDRYVPGKRKIISAVCRTNRVKLVYREGEDKRAYVPGHANRRWQWTAVLIGFASDLDYVEVLFASLMLQSSSEARRQGFRTTSEVSSFMVGFAEVVGRRLEEFNTKFVAGDHSKALALRDRSLDVDAKLRELYPKTGKMKQKGARDERANMAGRARGEYADVSGGRRNLGATKAIGS
jgi:hypothetical protein